jgi:hypothetical protein
MSYISCMLRVWLYFSIYLVLHPDGVDRQQPWAYKQASAPTWWRRQWVGTVVTCQFKYNYITLNTCRLTEFKFIRCCNNFSLRRTRSKRSSLKRRVNRDSQKSQQVQFSQCTIIESKTENFKRYYWYKINPKSSRNVFGYDFFVVSLSLQPVGTPLLYTLESWMSQAIWKLKISYKLMVSNSKERVSLIQISFPPYVSYCVRPSSVLETSVLALIALWIGLVCRLEW